MVVSALMKEMEWAHALIAGRFTRWEPRDRVREYLSGLVAGLERKNGGREDEGGALHRPDKISVGLNLLRRGPSA